MESFFENLPLLVKTVLTITGSILGIGLVFWFLSPETVHKKTRRDGP